LATGSGDGLKPVLPYRSRPDAGRFLAETLAEYGARTDVVVLGLAPGGVPLAAEIAAGLRAPLDAVVVGRLYFPSRPELTMGAIAPGGVRVLDGELIQALGLSAEKLDEITLREQAELEQRERLYRGGRAEIDLNHRTLILVDDGMATGLSMLAAVRYVRQQAPTQIVMAVPVASAGARERVRNEVDACVCPAIPEPFYSVGDWYQSFPQITDGEVARLLEGNR